MKYTKKIYSEWNPFLGSDRDTEIRNYTWKMVKTRKEHDCCLAQLVGNEPHIIFVGSFAMREHAIVEREWGSTYSCIDCMDKWLKEEAKIEDIGVGHG
jgi:hypothetical protein